MEWFGWVWLEWKEPLSFFMDLVVRGLWVRKNLINHKGEYRDLLYNHLRCITKVAFCIKMSLEGVVKITELEVISRFSRKKLVFWGLNFC